MVLPGSRIWSAGHENDRICLGRPVGSCWCRWLCSRGKCLLGGGPVLLVYQPKALKRMHTQLMSWQSWLEGTIGGPGRGASFFTAGWQLAEIRSLRRAARLTSLPARRSVSKRPRNLQGGAFFITVAIGGWCTPTILMSCIYIYISISSRQI